jgi:hypothetical protein
MYLSTKHLVDKGLWYISSWMAFLFACQIAHIITTTRVCYECESVCNIVDNQPLASGIWKCCSSSTISSPSSVQTLLAILHSSKECLQESSAAHNVHELVAVMCLWQHTSNVDKERRANLHRKFLTFDGTLTFLISIHSFSSALKFDRLVVHPCRSLFPVMYQHSVGGPNRENSSLLIVPSPTILLPAVT